MKAASGSLGALSAHTFLAMLSLNEASGTLFFGPDAASTLILLRGGKLASRTDLGADFDLDACGAQFSFWPHPESQPLPTLPSRYPDHQSLWPLPALSETPLLSTSETSLRALIAHLTEKSFNGAVVLENAAVQGLLLFQRGQLGGAAAEGDGQLRLGSAALRPLLHTPEAAALTLHALPEIVSASLLGWLLGLQVSNVGGLPKDFTGLELSATGARYHRAGEPYLHLQYPGEHAPGLYALCQSVPSLTLPTEPPGWERLRYGLTLRGRDALNPMTELSMRFQGEFGRAGRRALEGFRGDLNLEEAADALKLDLSELKTTVERLEAQGFIRPVSDPSLTPGGYTR